MNKANQGGIAIFGAQVVAAAGYRGCFVGTFIILFIRTSLKENYPELEKMSLIPDSTRQMPDKFVMFHVSYIFFQNMSRQRYVDIPDLHTSKRDDLSRPGFRRTLPTSIQQLPTFLEV